ncbi:MAG TPA: ARMT1-like domain-containing protein [Syntrophomonas sp.]|nr:ARMT1-like domain-containing protein [Syntrophomonas sp.]HRW13299.1 ARMT1-like domain-containing protein [Syntrophomonas sp.]
MKHSIDCLPCLLRQAVRTVKTHLHDEDVQRQTLQKVMAEMLGVGDDVSAPFIAHKIQNILVEVLGNPDPYKEDKGYYNCEMIKLEPELLRIRNASDDPFATALKLAAAGNIIDFGPVDGLSREKVLEIIDTTLETSLSQEALHSLHNDLHNAVTLLYLGDNAGEIVFDKIFVDTIKNSFPKLRIYFATRGKPVLNDITEDDAYLVGMDQLAEIINNGSNIPGTDLAYTTPSFKKIFYQADVVIAKGQGNFETLYGCRKANLYYLFLCKCNLFMSRLGAKQNDLVLLKE